MKKRADDISKEELKSIYEEELIRKDKIIESLKEQNLILTKVALKRRDEELNRKNQQPCPK